MAQAKSPKAEGTPSTLGGITTSSTEASVNFGTLKPPSMHISSTSFDSQRTPTQHKNKTHASTNDSGAGGQQNQQHTHNSMRDGPKTKESIDEEITPIEDAEIDPKLAQPPASMSMFETIPEEGMLWQKGIEFLSKRSVQSEGQLKAVSTQLDLFKEKHKFLGMYVMLGRDHRLQGGALAITVPTLNIGSSVLKFQV